MPLALRGRTLRVAGALSGAAALAAVLSVAAAAPAEATPCASGRVCLYENSNFNNDVRGDQFDFPASEGSFKDFAKLGHGLDNNMSSMRNKTNRWVYFCRNNGCPRGTDAYLAQPGTEDSTFSNNPVTGGGNYNDRFSGIIIMPYGYQPPMGGLNPNAKVP